MAAQLFDGSSVEVGQVAQAVIIVPPTLRYSSRDAWSGRRSRPRVDQGNGVCGGREGTRHVCRQGKVRRRASDLCDHLGQMHRTKGRVQPPAIGGDVYHRVKDWATRGRSAMMSECRRARRHAQMSTATIGHARPEHSHHRPRAPRAQPPSATRAQSTAIIGQVRTSEHSHRRPRPAKANISHKWRVGGAVGIPRRAWSRTDFVSVT